MKPRITIREIAENIGLHFTTVSLALRNSPKLRQVTRAKIQKLAKKMGYVPDPMLSALTVYRQAKHTPHFQSVLAWMNNWPERRGLLANPGFRLYYEAACARAKELGYLVEEFWLREPGMTPDKMRRILRARNIQGLLMAPQPRPYAHLDFDFTDFSAIAFGYSMIPPVLNVIASHHFHAMNLVIIKLHELGYRRIGLIIDFNMEEKLENGYMGAFALAHWRYPELEYIPPPSVEKKPFAEWLAKHRPDVVIGWDNTIAELQRLGYKVPKQLGFVSLNLMPGSNGEIAGVMQNDALIGTKAVNLLVGMIQQNETGVPRLPLCTLIESEWCPGKSLQQQKRAPK